MEDVAEERGVEHVRTAAAFLSLRARRVLTHGSKDYVSQIGITRANVDREPGVRRAVFPEKCLSECFQHT